MSDEWHNCDFCNKQAAYRRLPMLGCMELLSPWMWICDYCWPEAKTAMMNMLGASEPSAKEGE